ncbi:MAG: GPW/gp25 family protein [Pseudomonadota bacterium]
MNGINAQTGRSLSGINHLRQSIRDILTTPIGSRVMRRDYGSRLFELVDAPMNSATIIDLYAATAEALAQWEPRFRLTRARTESAEPGHIVLTLEGEYLPTGEMINLDGIQVS